MLSTCLVRRQTLLASWNGQVSGSSPHLTDLAFVCTLPRLTVIDNLKGLEGFRQPKVPTLVLYDEKDATKFKWGG